MALTYPTQHATSAVVDLAAGTTGGTRMQPRIQRFAGIAAGIAIAASLVAGVPVAARVHPAGTPAPEYRIVDDDGKAGITDSTNQPACDDQFDNSKNTNDDALAAGYGVVFTTVTRAVAGWKKDGNDALSNPYATIPAAPAGSVIYVCPGVYNENVTVASPISIVGPKAGMNNWRCRARAGEATIIGTTTGPALDLTASDITVRGMRIANTQGNGVRIGAATSGIRLNSSVIQSNSNGVVLQGAGQTIRGNCFRDNNSGGPASGIKAGTGGATNVVINRNGFIGNRTAAIDLTEGDSAVSGVTIRGNRSLDNVIFVRIDKASEITVADNMVDFTTDISFSSSSTAAIQVKGAGAATITISGNHIDTNNPRAISIEDPASNVIVEDNRISSVEYGVYVGTKVNPGLVQVRGNRISDVLNTGIQLDTDTRLNEISGNRILGIVNLACQDKSDGGPGTAGTYNTWTNNKSTLELVSPIGICTQI